VANSRLEERVTRAAEATLAEQSYVSAVVSAATESSPVMAS
jgi:hypothetical protein